MMVRSYQNELWKEINLDNRFKKDERFFISNFCRIVKEVNEEKLLLPERYVNGYQVIYAKLLNEKSKRRAVYVHKLMAETFLEKKENQQFVLHLNYDKKDNAFLIAPQVPFGHQAQDELANRQPAQNRRGNAQVRP